MKSKKKSQITDDEIQKAFDELAEEADLQKAEGEEEEELEEDLEESEENEEEGDDEEDEEDDEEDEDTEKGNDDDLNEDDDEEEEEEEKVVKKKKVIAKAVNPDVKKGIEVSPFLKGIVNDIEKSNNETRKILGDVAVIVKSLVDRMDDVEDSLNTTPRKKKSAIRKSEVVDRFSKANDEEFEEESSPKTLGIRKDHRAILNTLDELSGINNNDGKVDMEFAKAMQSFEISKTLPANIIAKLKKEHNVIIDPTR